MNFIARSSVPCPSWSDPSCYIRLRLLYKRSAATIGTADLYRFEAATPGLGIETVNPGGKYVLVSAYQKRPNSGKGALLYA